MPILDYFQNGQFSKTISEYEAILSPDADEKMIAAGAYFRIGDLSKSIKACDEIYHVMADRLDFIALYGAVLRTAGQLQKAKETFQHGLDLGGKNLPPFMNNYSNLLVDLGEEEEALLILERLVEQDPQYHDAIMNIQRIKELKQQKENANKSLIDEVNISEENLSYPEGDDFDPLLLAFTDDESKYTLEQYLKGKESAPTENVKTDKNDEPPQKLNSLISSDNEELLRLAQANKQNNPELTIRTCNKLIKNGCAPKALNPIAAEAYINLGKLDLAELFYTKAIAEGVSTVDIYVNLAQLCRMRNAFKEAKVYIGEAKKLEVPHALIQQISSEIINDLKDQNIDVQTFPE